MSPPHLTRDGHVDGKVFFDRAVSVSAIIRQQNQHDLLAGARVQIRYVLLGRVAIQADHGGPAQIHPHRTSDALQSRHQFSGVVRKLAGEDARPIHQIDRVVQS